jgi:hypothetical protein
MSTIKVNSIKNTSTDDGGIAIDNSGHVQVDGVQLPTAGALSNRNLVVNGGMRVAQRGTSFADATSDTYAADRWEYERSTSAVVTVSQETDAPPGYKNSIKAEITTADTSTAATAFTQFLYKIEANDISHLAYGTADAKTCTISFWAKHSLAGTYPFSVQNHNGTRVFPSSYTINTANTWEYKTITFAGDTGGTWTTNGTETGMRFILCWNMGSNFTGGTAGAWAATTGYADLTPTTGPDINGTVGNTVQWSGVQLEVGSKATPFEHRSYGDDLAKCQRYYYKHVENIGKNYANATYYTSTLIAAHISFPTTMRVAPSLEVESGTNYYRAFRNGAADDFDNMTIVRAHVNGAALDASGTGASGTAGHGAVLATQNANSFIAFTAEL